MAGTAQHATRQHTRARGSVTGRSASADPAGLGEPEFLSVEQFCTMTGLSSSTARRLIAHRQIPTYQPGGPRCRVLIHRDALGQIQEPNQASGATGAAPAAEEDPARLPGPLPRWRQSRTSNLKPKPEEQNAPAIEE